MGSRGSLLALLVVAGTTATAIAAPAPRPAGSLRRDLDALHRSVEGAVAQVAPAAAGWSGAPAARAYRLEGVGIVVVLPARLLPSTRRSAATPVDPKVTVALDEALRGLEQSLARADTPEARRQIRQSLQALRQTRGRLVTHTSAAQGQEMPPEMEAHVAAMRAQVDAFREDGERMRQEAEHELEQHLRAIAGDRGERPPLPPGRAAVVSSGAAAPTPTMPPEAPMPMLAPFPPAPWEFWFASSGAPDTRSADEVLSDVRKAAVEALVAHRGPWDALSPDEMVSVAVDFLPRRGSPGPPRTLSLRVKAGDLAAQARGKLAPDELRRRIHSAEY